MKKQITKVLLAFTILLLLAGQTHAQNEVAGTILYHLRNNKPIAAVTVKLYDTNNTLVETAETDFNGSYEFTGVDEGTYYIEASTTAMPGGINMADAQKVRHHINGNRTLDEIEQMAADVAEPFGEINWDDYDAIVAWFMDGVPFTSDSWVFQVIENIQVGNPMYKARTNVPTMGGSSAGDVNGTFVPTTRNAKELLVNYTKKAVSSNFSIEVSANDIPAAAAMGLVIKYPAGKVNISDITSPLGEIKYNIRNGEIRISWISESSYEQMVSSGMPVVIINGTTTSQYDGSDIRFTIDPESHFSDREGNEIETRFSLPLLSGSAQYLGASYPNPANGITTIDYIVPSTGHVNISIYSITGQLVNVLVNETMPAGAQYVRFNTNGMEKGVYFYTLSVEGSDRVNESRRMIIAQ